MSASAVLPGEPMRHRLPRRCSRSDDLHVTVGGQAGAARRLARGARRRSARHHGTERLGQEHAGARADRAPRLRHRLGQRAAFRDGTCSHSRPSNAHAPDCSSAFSTRSRSRGSTMPICSRPPLNAARRERGLTELDAFDFLALVRDEDAARCTWTRAFLSRGVNEGFSGGESKRNEILQMLVLEPTLALLDETDSGLDIDALKLVAHGVNTLRAPSRAIVLVTHYQRLLDYVVPDQVHVLAHGRIVRSGDRTLALELEQRGYDWVSAPRRLEARMSSSAQPGAPRCPEPLERVLRDFEATLAQLPESVVSAAAPADAPPSSCVSSAGPPAVTSSGAMRTCAPSTACRASLRPHRPADAAAASFFARAAAQVSSAWCLSTESQPYPRS